MIQLNSTVKCNRPMSVEGKNSTLRLPPNQVGKVVKVHTDYDPPCWFGCEFKHPTEPFIISLHIANLAEIGADGEEIVAPEPVTAPKTRQKRAKGDKPASSKKAEPEIDEVSDDDVADLEAFLVLKGKRDGKE